MTEIWFSKSPIYLDSTETYRKNLQFNEWVTDVIGDPDPAHLQRSLQAVGSFSQLQNESWLPEIQ